MKKIFLIKTAIVFAVLLFISLLQWKITLGKSICEINFKKIKAEKSFIAPTEINSNEYGFYPFEDFIIKI